MESSACRIVLCRRLTLMGRSIDARSTYSMAIGRCSSCENLRSVSVRPTPFELKLEARLSRRSEEHTSELQSRLHLVCRLLLEKKKKITANTVANNKSNTCVHACSPKSPIAHLIR